jgi:hypothetical protein
LHFKDPTNGSHPLRLTDFCPQNLVSIITALVCVGGVSEAQLVHVGGVCVTDFIKSTCRGVCVTDFRPRRLSQSALLKLWVCVCVCVIVCV